MFALLRVTSLRLSDVRQAWLLGLSRNGELIVGIPSVVSLILTQIVLTGYVLGVNASNACLAIRVLLMAHGRRYAALPFVLSILLQ